MNDSTQNLDPALEALLLHKAYEQLSVQERELVATHISEEQYHSFSQILLSTRELKQQRSIAPDPNLQTQLLQQFRQAHRKPTFWNKIIRALQHPVPSWQVGLACLLLCLGTYFLSNQNNPNLSNVNTTKAEQYQEGQVIFTSRSAKEEKELQVLFTGIQ